MDSVDDSAVTSDLLARLEAGSRIDDAVLALVDDLHGDFTFTEIRSAVGASYDDLTVDPVLAQPLLAERLTRARLVGDRERDARSISAWVSERPDRSGLFVWDVERDTWYWSPGLARLIGYPPADPAPATADVLEHIVESDRRLLAESIAGALSRGLGFAARVRLSTFGGLELPVLVVADVETAADGRVREVRGIVSSPAPRGAADLDED